MENLLFVKFIYNIFMYNSIWFNSLTKPYLNPPSEIFTPIWIILYILIFISLLIYIIKPVNTSKISGYIYFSIQLFLNLIWSPVFFFMQNIGFALFVILLLNVFVFLTMKSFYKVSPISAFLLIPYFIWVLFATYLNGAYFVLN